LGCRTEGRAREKREAKITKELEEKLKALGYIN
jgi:hypothetical protein